MKIKERIAQHLLNHVHDIFDYVRSTNDHMPGMAYEHSSLTFVSVFQDNALKNHIVRNWYSNSWTYDF